MALTGELGAGKTLFTKGVGKSLGISQDCITSPTFTLIHEYPGRIPLIHVDLYRLESQVDVESLGLSEYFDSDYVVVIEWADRLGRALPTDRLDLHFVHGDEEGTRWIMLNGTGPKSREVETHLPASLSEHRSRALNPRFP